MRQAQQPRLGVRVVAELAPEACGVVLANNRSRRAFVGLAQRPVALKRRAVIGRKAPCIRTVRVPLLYGALRVVHELVDDAALLACSPAVGCYGIEGGKGCCRAVEGLFGDGGAAVVLAVLAAETDICRGINISQVQCRSVATMLPYQLHHQRTDCCSVEKTAPLDMYAHQSDHLWINLPCAVAMTLVPP